MNIIELARDALKSATPGPWEISGRESVSGIINDDWADDEFARSNKRLAALAPELAAEVVRLHDEFAALADAVDQEAEAKSATGNFLMGEYHGSFAARIRAALEGVEIGVHSEPNRSNP